MTSFDPSFEAYLKKRMDFNRDQGNETITQIQLNIQHLNQQVQQLDSFISRLSDSTDEGEKQRNLFNEKAQKIQELSKETNSLMKSLVEMSNSNRSLRVHRERLQNEFIGVLNRLQAAQRKAAQTEKAGMRQAKEAAEMDAEASKAAEQDFYSNEQQHQQSVHEQNQQIINLQEIKERQQNLQQLEKDIGDVNVIFAELAKMVHEQGDMVDSIEANVEHAQIYVEQGSQNVQQAVYYNQKARQKKLLLIGFFVILILILLLTIYLAR